MLMHELQRSKSKKDKAMRRGRWNASGRGNYSTRWMKGQGQRAGWSSSPWFEWGQTPLHMRLPKKKGFKRYFKLLKDVCPINVALFDNHEKVAAGDTITMDYLVDLWVCNKEDKVKVLGHGDLSKSLTFKWIELFSGSARTKIEKAGWTIEA